MIRKGVLVILVIGVVVWWFPKHQAAFTVESPGVVVISDPQRWQEFLDCVKQTKQGDSFVCDDEMADAMIASVSSMTK